MGKSTILSKPVLENDFSKPSKSPAAALRLLLVAWREYVFVDYRGPRSLE
jgi:hypothetical protein